MNELAGATDTRPTTAPGWRPTGESGSVPLGMPTLHRRMGAGIDGLIEAEVERGQRLEGMRNGTLASIHSWELVTAVDGPGTRMTIFFAGCPLRCVYCHNPDTMFMRNGQDVTLDEIVARIKRYRRVFKASGGGITLSGGEVLMQSKFARNVLHAAKEMGVHTAIDTSGFLGVAADDDFLRDVDLVLLDVKSGSEEVYRNLTGRPLQPTIDFGDRLEKLGVKIWIRFVVVPGWTEDPENVENIADIVCRWPQTVERVEVLPFHNMGQDKWDTLDLHYKLRDVDPPSNEVVERVRDQFRARGLTVY
jgi:pyruvate formate lyase activating enzyme